MALINFNNVASMVKISVLNFDDVDFVHFNVLSYLYYFFDDLELVAAKPSLQNDSEEIDISNKI